MNHTCYIDKDLNILISGNGTPIQNPAVLIDPASDTIHKWGEQEFLEKQLPRYITYHKAMDEPNTTMLIAFDNPDFRLPLPHVCYIIRRMTEFTATGFITEFGKHLFDNDLLVWLESEMQRIPIPVYESEWKS